MDGRSWHGVSAHQQRAPQIIARGLGKLLGVHGVVLGSKRLLPREIRLALANRRLAQPREVAGVESTAIGGIDGDVTQLDAERGQRRGHRRWSRRDPLLGNLADATRRVPATPTPTVHYISTKHPCGTSFGGWAPAAEHSGSRPGLTTITIELPRYRDAAKALGDIVQLHAATLAAAFLGLP
jgi:hypothetical protein